MRMVLMCFVMVFFSIDAMNPVCNQKALNRRARSYVEVISEQREVDKELLLGSLQFLSGDALRDPMVAMLVNEDIFLDICNRASGIIIKSNFVNVCKEVFTKVDDPLKKAQVSMLLNAVLRLFPRQESSTAASGLERLVLSSNNHYLLEPLD